jgi:glycosyltransferase involved in cell wall biosynthesis
MSSAEVPPVLSVILPVYNGTATLDRALRSVQTQTFADWELVAVDDGSTDASHELLQRWAATDGRIRVARLEENSGVSAARNAAIRLARGRFVTYLDRDDEYYHDYLAQVARHCDQADVLMFAYDLIYDGGPASGRRESWDPSPVRQNLFIDNITIPLGVAHRRELWERVGGFNEMWCVEDWDFWKRLTRSGAKFTYLSLKSGCYHVRPTSGSRIPHLTRRQRETFVANWEAGKPLYGGRPLGTSLPNVRRIAFASPHCLADPTSGAAIAAAQTMRFLTTLGFECAAFCGSYLDLSEEGHLEEILARQNNPCEAQTVDIGGYQARMILTQQGPLPVTIFRSSSTRGRWLDQAEVAAFLQAYAVFLDTNRPEAILTYGADGVAEAMIKLAKNRDIPIVFGLYDFADRDPASFKLMDYVIVPSEFSRRYHWEELGVACQLLPPAMDWQRVQVPERTGAATGPGADVPRSSFEGSGPDPGPRKPPYATFVNPHPAKGLYVFARIAEVLALRRPDIPLLVAEGRCRAGWQQETGIEVEQLPNLTVRPGAGDPREFYAATKLLLMPSLGNDSFGLVAAEAMLNGIPVLGSNRGALPETIGGAGFVLDIPARYTPRSYTLPTAEEVEPWVETIIRLWDDAEFYQQASEAARQHAERWRPERLAAGYREFFSSLFPQPSPPVVPLGEGDDSEVGVTWPRRRKVADNREQSLVSVILPVCNGEATLDRAIRSVQAQTFSNWELVAVDDGSTDGSHAALQRWAGEDARIRVVRLDENCGPGAARNAGLREARGELVAYLDHDDEYYPDYLAQVAGLADKADVLVFAYDIVQPDGQGGDQVTSWEPGTARHELFSAHIAMPMAVAHRRPWVEKAGGFNELLWWEEDAEFWRRLARAGADLLFVSHKSGRYYVRPDSRRRAPRLTRQQREVLEANWRARRPIYTPAEASLERPTHAAQLGNPKSKVPKPVRKIAFISPHSVIDYSSGAAIATASALRFLRQIGFECEAFCGSYLDVPEDGHLEEMLARQNSPYELRSTPIGEYQARMIFALQGTLPVTVFRAASTRGQWKDEAEVTAFLQAYTEFLEKYRPDAVWTYGGDAVAAAMVKLARDRHIPVVFALHNFSYHDVGSFASVDYVTVPSDFSRQYHWAALGLACHTLPNAIDWQRVQVTGREPRFATFVNPQTTKGIYIFAKIAEELARRRPDIMLMVIEGRSHTAWRQETGIDLGRLPNVNVMSSMGDPRSFYVLSRLLLMPSLWNESFGLTAAEAMLNGIPVLASNRGALPETIGDGGLLFDIPACYTPQSCTLPTAEEVEPWVKTIIRLWDDADFYQQASETARQRAERWRPERLAETYREFFGSISLQPGPPLVP